jgi:hypothetical protein
VAATGFLPGALSFLRALSHLERVTHRLGKTCLFNNNHLPHLERGYTQARQLVSLISFPYKENKTTRLSNEHTTTTNHTQPRTVWPPQSTGTTNMGFPKQVTDRRFNITRLSNYETLWFSQPTTQDDFLVLVLGMRKGTQRFK